MAAANVFSVIVRSPLLVSEPTLMAVADVLPVMVRLPEVMRAPALMAVAGRVAADGEFTDRTREGRLSSPMKMLPLISRPSETGDQAGVDGHRGRIVGDSQVAPDGGH